MCRFFTARRYAQALSLLSSGVRLSVRPSCSCNCIQTAEDIVKLLSRSGSTITVVFFGTPALIPNYRGDPSSWALNTWDGTNLQFSTEIDVHHGKGTR